MLYTFLDNNDVSERLKITIGIDSRIRTFAAMFVLVEQIQFTQELDYR